MTNRSRTISYLKLLYFDISGNSYWILWYCYRKGHIDCTHVFIGPLSYKKNQNVKNHCRVKYSVMIYYRNWPWYGLRWSGWYCNPEQHELCRPSCGRAGRHTECCSGLQYQPRQRRPYKWSISILPRSQFTKSKGNLRFRRLVPLFVPIGVCVTTHDSGTASDITIGMWRHNHYPTLAREFQGFRVWGKFVFLTLELTDAPTNLANQLKVGHALDQSRSVQSRWPERAHQNNEPSWRSSRTDRRLSIQFWDD